MKLLDKTSMSIKVGLQHLFGIIVILGKQFDTLFKPFFLLHSLYGGHVTKLAIFPSEIHPQW